MEKNVVIFGESGNGKSSIVNLLLGRKAAEVSDSAIGCTFEFQKYKVTNLTNEVKNFTLFDTVGLSEGSHGTVKQSFAVKKLINLLKSLEEGVSLLVFVMEKGKIKKSLDENYKLFVEAICMSHVPVLLMITHCEMEEEIGTWWTQNKVHFDKYGMEFAAVVSGCSMDHEKVPALMRPMIQTLNKQTYSLLKASIENNLLDPGWKVKGGWKTWFESIFRLIANVFPFFKWIFPSLAAPEEPSLQVRLYNYFKTHGYEDLVARQMARDIENSV